MIIVIGAPADRLELARQLGGDVALSIETDPIESRLETVLELTDGHGADVVIEASGNPAYLRKLLREDDLWMDSTVNNRFKVPSLKGAVS